MLYILKHLVCVDTNFRSGSNIESQSLHIFADVVEPKFRLYLYSTSLQAIFSIR
jgi:hypothetical protein